MFSYPLTFENEQEHVCHVRENPEFYKRALQEIWEDEAKKMEERLKVKELERAQAFEMELKAKREIFEQSYTHKLQEMTRVFKEREQKLIADANELKTSLKNRESVNSSTYTGKCDEKYVEMVLKTICTDDCFTVDGCSKMKMMDIRVTDHETLKTVGIECKDKITVTKADIDKFKRDHIQNNFHRSIFISTCAIPGILTEENNVHNVGNYFYVYTKNHIFLLAVLKQFFSSLNFKEEIKPDKFGIAMERMLMVYREWQNCKKSLAKLDQSILTTLNLTEDYEKIIKGHLYMVTKSKLKGGKI